MVAHAVAALLAAGMLARRPHTVAQAVRAVGVSIAAIRDAYQARQAGPRPAPAADAAVQPDQHAPSSTVGRRTHM